MYTAREDSFLNFDEAQSEYLYRSILLIFYQQKILPILKINGWWFRLLGLWNHAIQTIRRWVKINVFRKSRFHEISLTDHCLVQIDLLLCLGEAVGGLDGMVQLQHSGSYSYSGIYISPEAEFMTVQFCWGFLGIILRVLRLKMSVCNVYSTNQFQTTFA